MRMNQNFLNAKYNRCSGICLGDIAEETKHKTRKGRAVMAQKEREKSP